MAELKRCPFCGELPTTNVSVVAMNLQTGDKIRFEVACKKCGTCKGVYLNIPNDCVGFMEVDKAMEEATKAWNTRWDDE